MKNRENLLDKRTVHRHVLQSFLFISFNNYKLSCVLFASDKTLLFFEHYSYVMCHLSCVVCFAFFQISKHIRNVKAHI